MDSRERVEIREDLIKMANSGTLWLYPAYYAVAALWDIAESLATLAKRA